MSEFMTKLEAWLDQPLLGETLRKELEELKAGADTRSTEIEDRFYKDLEFGTGGLRGILGAGTNRMNVHTVARAIQGIADYTWETFEARDNQDGGKKPSFAISYDSRIQSDEFAELCGQILTNNGIDVYLFNELMPTPVLSFGVRYYGCDGGIMITASHNPSQYNGLKVYNREGCQETLEAAARIMEKIEGTELFRGILREPPMGKEKGTLQRIPETTIQAYLDAVEKEAMPVDCRTGELKIVYTPLNGAGNRPVREILSRVGVRDIYVVKEQEFPDGHFPTCPYPNPEKEEALTLAKKLFLELREKASGPEEEPDLLLATDPDADRIGVAAFQNGELRIFTGNEIGILLFDFICSTKDMPENPVAIRTIVSTRMVDAIAEHHGVKMITTLTGFKFIGEQIGLLEKDGEVRRFIFGFEESVGYLSGSHVRDKDAVNAAMLICQMAGYWKKQGKTLGSRLEELYSQFGYWKNDLMEFAFEGPRGMEQMSGILGYFRTNFFEEFGGKDIMEIVDYSKRTRRILKTEVCCSMVSGTRPTNLPASDVMEYVLEGQNSFQLRPSGTEPKFKIYLSARAESQADAEAFLTRLKEQLTGIIREAAKGE
jgi:phosphoglucomutase